MRKQLAALAVAATALTGALASTATATADSPPSRIEACDQMVKLFQLLESGGPPATEVQRSQAIESMIADGPSSKEWAGFSQEDIDQVSAGMRDAVKGYC